MRAFPHTHRSPFQEGRQTEIAAEVSVAYDRSARQVSGFIGGMNNFLRNGPQHMKDTGSKGGRPTWQEADEKARKQEATERARHGKGGCKAGRSTPRSLLQ